MPVETAPENEQPFVDSPILQAKRQAFDHPTQENLTVLIDTVHDDTRSGFHNMLRAKTERINKLEARIKAALAEYTAQKGIIDHHAKRGMNIPALVAQNMAGALRGE